MSNGINNPATFTGYTNIGLIKPSAGQTIVSIPIIAATSTTVIYTVPVGKTFFCTSLSGTGTGGGSLEFFINAVQTVYYKNVVFLVLNVINAIAFVANAGDEIIFISDDVMGTQFNGTLFGWLE